ncbi:hypothetical protein EDB83DRAFT_2548498, partial [Lactarius deliciosus]
PLRTLPRSRHCACIAGRLCPNITILHCCLSLSESRVVSPGGDATPVARFFGTDAGSPSSLSIRRLRPRLHILLNVFPVTLPWLWPSDAPSYSGSPPRTWHFPGVRLSRSLFSRTRDSASEHTQSVQTG